MRKSKFRRTLNHYFAIFLTLLREKKYRAYDTRVKYMFFPEHKSNTLIVSFPACTQNTAKYNYIRTLHPFKCNKLFLLDDFGVNHQGCYLVKDNVELCTKELIEKIVRECSLRNRGQMVDNQSDMRVVFVGSSKGGYSALNFSFLIPNTIAIIGAPQYYLGRYLDKEGTQVNLQYIIGEINEEKKRELDNRLKERIGSSEIKPKIVYLHYSKVEHTYIEHVKDLIFDLKESKTCLIEDVATYPEHSELASFYSPFLVKILKTIWKQ
ncbi:MAG: hypothetical protein HUJ96_02095 [Marinilabiliaceae bacterium]|nr:hypothetical protein [Marinilabiliaceae bacterium]